MKRLLIILSALILVPSAFAADSDLVQKAKAEGQVSFYANMTAIQPIMVRFGIRASLTVPLQAEKRRIGGLSVATPEQRCWSYEEIALVEAVGQQLGGAAERFRLLDKIREQAAERFGFDPKSIMIHATQSHATPCVGNHMIHNKSEYITEDLAWVHGGDDRYDPFAAERIVEAIGQAAQSAEPVAVTAGRSFETRVAHNRRFIMRDGMAKTHPVDCDPDILHAEGPIDPEVGVMCFVTEALL